MATRGKSVLLDTSVVVRHFRDGILKLLFSWHRSRGRNLAFGSVTPTGIPMPSAYLKRRLKCQGAATVAKSGSLSASHDAYPYT